ncbi:hypothetical protein TSTA_097370 [Talaromyces stipitatus ATCC 10500]|uniref:Uncharacterized protein n=1 Tax=Talaromyces stipitatus (strain ATCC 10500 / CBS 375.48 / QM 6759 / NRRL 1006) TaxID=441959 RepID=B8MLW9_TALSN|nr:uncharacterized protein TSTA_097370 [Talaromyces stipitatus ATCC 10500]EED13481.1 hypothetical protein TSTA_097370 [Talaromyces stipitatus ATCC 10500]
MVEYDSSAPTITQRAAALKKAMTEVQKLYAERQSCVYSYVRVWREGNTSYTGEWKGPYKLLSVESEMCIIQFPDEPKQFHITVVRLYYKAPDENNQDTNSEHTNEEPEAPLGTNSIPSIPQDDEPDTSTSQARPAQRPQRNWQLLARY